MKHPIFTAFLIVFLAVFTLLAFSNIAMAQMPTKMIGYAWAPNFGWINFGTNDAPRVNVDSTTGIFTGYGWSPNIGWIRMGVDLTGPTKNETGVKATPTATGATIAGWMRACSVYQAGCSGLEKSVTGTERGGWDGWFKMKTVTYDSTSKKYSGFSWGDLVGGWVNFSANTGPVSGCVGATCCTSSQTWNGAQCVDNPNIPCDSTKETCGGGGGGGPTYSCSANPSSIINGGLTVWTAYVDGIVQTNRYSYAWTFDGGTGLTTGSPVSRTYDYSATGNNNHIASLIITDTQNVTHSVICQGYVTVTPNQTCNLLVQFNGSGTVSYNGTSYAQSPTINNVPCGGITLTSGPVWWSNGVCPTPPVRPLSGTKTSFSTGALNYGLNTVCADFGGNGSGTGVIGGNPVRINNTLARLNYPLSSTVAQIHMSAGGTASSISAIDWGGLDTKAASVAGCSGANAPRICIGMGNDTNCVSSDYSHPLSNLSNVTLANQSIKFYFPNKCQNNTNGISVFHKTANWIVKLKINGVDTNLILNFNDANGTNQSSLNLGN